MTMDTPGDGAWFAPKRYGYGAGLPIAWQGWALMAAHVAAIFAGLPLAQRWPCWFAAWTLIVALVPLPLYAAKTRGGWKWRWGAGD
jgi:hypothetical protein